MHALIVIVTLEGLIINALAHSCVYLIANCFSAFLIKVGSYQELHHFYNN